MSPRIILVSLPLLSGLHSRTITPPAGRLIEDHLRPCPNRPNCVSSDSGTIDPIAPISFQGNPENAWQEIRTAIAELGGKIIHSGPTYLWSTFTSTLFGFVDDVELRMEPEEKLIHIRSGARVGYFDFGVNRKRVEKIRKLFFEQKTGKKITVS
jgi:uncharacterized protein (DUF1499 family)